MTHSRTRRSAVFASLLLTVALAGGCSSDDPDTPAGPGSTNGTGSETTAETVTPRLVAEPTTAGPARLLRPPRLRRAR